MEIKNIEANLMTSSQTNEIIANSARNFNDKVLSYKPKINAYAGENSGKIDIFTPLGFKNDLFSAVTDFVFNHRACNYRQAELKAVVNFAFLLAYAGVKMTPIASLDLCDTEKGKSDCIRLTDKITIHWVQDESEIQILHDFSGASKEYVWDNIDDNIAIYGSWTELGVQISAGNNQSDVFLGAICDQFGSNSFTLPSTFMTRKRKREQDGDDMPKKGRIYKNIYFTFSFDSTLSYIPKNTLFKHINGGLFNRPIIYYSALDWVKPYFSENEQEAENITRKVKEFVNWAKKRAGHEIKPINENPIYLQFLADTKELKRLYPKFKNLYARANMKFLAAAKVFHYLNDYQNAKFSDKASDEILLLTRDFLWQYLDYGDLIAEIEKVPDDSTLRAIKDRLLKKLSSHNFNDAPYPVRKLVANTKPVTTAQVLYLLKDGKDAIYNEKKSHILNLI